MNNIGNQKFSFFNSLFPTTALKVLFGMFCVSFVFWTVLAVTGAKYTAANYLISVPLILITFFGGVSGIWQTVRHMVVKELQKPILLLSTGLLFWCLGSVIFMLYNVFLHVEAPYPSLADIAYLPAPVFWIIGLVYLCKAVDVESHLRLVVGRILFFLLPTSAVILSFYALIFVPNGSDVHFFESPVELFFNFIYPVFDVLIMVVLSLLIYGVCFRLVRTEYTVALVVIAGSFIVNYFADYIFAYTTSHDTYFVGNFADLLFIVAMFGIGWGANLLAAKNQE